MSTAYVEIYNNNKIKVKKIKLDNLHIDSNTLEFTQDQYATLYSSSRVLKDIIANVLMKLINITDSKDAFIATVGHKDNYCTLCYYCVYINISGMSFKCQESYQNIQLTKETLLSRFLEYYTISNNVETDPRSHNTKKIEHHPNIQTFVGIPLKYDGKIIGQLGLANAEKYTVKTIENIMPLLHFCGNFLHSVSIENKLIHQNIELKKELVILKESFIATMSHEIRTPLNGIVGMARLLGELPELSDSKPQEYIHILNECSLQLMELVNDILDFSKMTAGGVTLYNHPFSLQDCISGAVDIVTQRLNDKELEMKLVLSDFPSKVSGDSRRLKQILINLLTNAIKFTEKGTVTLTTKVERISTETDYSNNIRVTFIITDTGIGISKLDQERIFEIFTKLHEDDQHHTNTSPGAGMGLAISKLIVTAMGGKISVHSDGKTGSTFTFDVILEDESNIKELLEQHAEGLSNKHVLVVDDAEDNRIFLMEILYSWKMRATCFSSAREAISFMRSHQQFDLAIIDLYMPIMSGVELVQTMREYGYKQPVIGLSSIGHDIVGKEWFDHFATKPTSKSRLFSLVLRCLMSHNISKQLVIAHRPATIRKELQILIAEDDYYNQILITELLKSIGYTNVKIVGNGKLCVEELEHNPNYDICFMDIKMPVMDGLDATRIIKRKMIHPPLIIAVSASVLDVDKNKCFGAGMDGYIPKPIERDQLSTVLDRLKVKLSSTEST